MVNAHDYVINVLKTRGGDKINSSGHIKDQFVRLTKTYFDLELETIIAATFKGKIFVYIFSPEHEAHPSQKKCTPEPACWHALNASQASHIFSNPPLKKRILPWIPLRFDIDDLWVVNEEADILLSKKRVEAPMDMLYKTNNTTSTAVECQKTKRHRSVKDSILASYMAHKGKAMTFPEWIKEMVDAEYVHEDIASYNKVASRSDDSNEFVKKIALIKNGLTKGKNTGQQKYLVVYRTLSINNQLSPLKKISYRTVEEYFKQ